MPRCSITPGSLWLFIANVLFLGGWLTALATDHPSFLDMGLGVRF